MRTTPRFVMASILGGVAIILSTGQPVVSQQPPRGGVAVAAGSWSGTNLDALRQWDADVDRMTHTGDLVVMSRRGDRALAGRTHEYLAQVVAGIPVHGGGITRQLDRSVTVSLFGTMWCFRHQLLLSRPYLLQTKALTLRFRNRRCCRCNNRL